MARYGEIKEEVTLMGSLVYVDTTAYYDSGNQAEVTVLKADYDVSKFVENNREKKLGDVIKELDRLLRKAVEANMMERELD